MSELAIRGGTPVRAGAWPKWPARGPEEEQALLEVLRDGDWGGFPMPNLRARNFGEAFARRHDCRFSQCVANGTVSLEIGLQAMGVEPGAEVIVPAYTFEATAAAALFSGCVPVFVDIDPHTYCIDPEAVEAAITPRTQAVVPVHLAMNVADMDRLGAIAERHCLRVLEDCAHAHGARWRGRGVGSLGDAGSFSFQTSKLMTAGEGGIVLTNDERILDGLFALTNCGRQRPGRSRDFEVVGHNYRMTDLQAAVLEVQLSRLDDQHRHRGRSAEVLAAGIEPIDGLEPLRVDPRITTQAIYQYVLRYAPDAFGGLPRDSFVAALNAEGVPCEGVFYEAVYNSKLFRMDADRYPTWAAAPQRPDCPVAMRAAYEESVWFSHHLLLGTREDLEQIVEAIQKVCALAGDLLGYEHEEIERMRKARTER